MGEWLQHATTALAAAWHGALSIATSTTGLIWLACWVATLLAGYVVGRADRTGRALARQRRAQHGRRSAR